ncbi:acyltransferase family protein [Aquipseudomonas alcaligenes]|uniref:acyltransferase family protein n=1 Tax=Aquipseudomonas alcaligenes TaxID=43263 RepID=UPI0019444213|nr:acyltransferase [Pseudomonas alcaligenes]
MRYAHIDSLRGVAAILVLWMHSAGNFLMYSRPTFQNMAFDLAHQLDFGRMGVVLFFAISGFVIPSSLRGDVFQSSKRFLVKRALRLYPLYWASIPIGVITWWYIWGKVIDVEAVLWNFTMIQGLFDYKSVMGLYWTLQVELIFYTCCIVLFLCGVLHSSITLALLVTVFSAPLLMSMGAGLVGINAGVSLSPETSMLLLHLGVMLWGALFRQWHDGVLNNSIARLIMYGYALFWVLGSMVAVYNCISGQAGMELLRFWLPYTIAVIGFLICASAVRVRYKPLVWLGTVSYSIYLMHMPVVHSLLWLVRNSEITWIKGWPLGAYMALIAAITILVAFVTYRLIEQPAMRYADSILMPNG